MAQNETRILWVVGCSILSLGSSGCTGQGPEADVLHDGTDQVSAAEKSASVTLPSILSDRMVIQQERPVAIWGKGPQNTKVCVTVQRASSSVATSSGCTTVARSGDWKVVLAAMEASFTPYTIVVENQGSKKILHDVVVGEVWLTSGQSNMELQLRYTLEREKLLADANHPNIRIYYQDHISQAMTSATSQFPLFDTVGGVWQKAVGTQNTERCSGTAYAFARALYHYFENKGKEVPVAVINTAVGATGIEAWMSRQKLASDVEFAAHLPQQWQGSRTDASPQPYLQPTACFNHKIAPLTPLALRGFLWTQGEGRSGTEADAVYYRKALRGLIDDWREQWNLPNMPFIMTQGHPYAWPYGWVSKLDDSAYHREAQLEAAASVPLACAQPIHDVELTWDWGDFKYTHPIHPLSKMPVGERMARAAFSLAYNDTQEYTGPIYGGLQIQGAKAVVSFTHAASALVVKDASSIITGFAVAGQDHVFVPAQARITGPTTVEVWSPSIQKPVAVTYGFTVMNQKANLFNSAGLPASPFRSDKVASQFLRIKPTFTYEAELQALAGVSPGAGDRVFPNPLASRGAVRLFSPQASGHFISYKIRIPSDGTYRIAIGAMQGKSYGNSQLFVNGVPTGSVQNFYAQVDSLIRRVLVEETTLKAGFTEFRFSHVGQAPVGNPQNLGLDFVELTPIGPSHPSIHEDWQ